jgi:hypothetical protein
MPWDEVVSLNKEALSSRVFADACGHSLEILAIVCELAAEAGFTSLDGVYETTPEIIKNYCRIARAALRALKKLEERKRILD